jgi:phospholipase D1/2
MASDSEINIGVTGQAYAAPLRQKIFSLQSGGDVQGGGSADEWPVAFTDWKTLMAKNRDIQMAGTKKMKGFLLPFEDHRATTTLHASIMGRNRCSRKSQHFPERFLR